MSRETFGQALRRRRTTRGLSLRELARRANCGKSYVLDLEQEHSRHPAPSVAAALDDALEADGELVALAEAAARHRDLLSASQAGPGTYPHPDLAALVLMGAEGEVDPMERRSFVLGLAAPGLALEALRQGFVASLAEERAAAAVDDWQEIVAEHGHHIISLPPAEHLEGLTVDLLALQLAADRQPGDAPLRELRRVGAPLAVFMAMVTADLGRVREASRWWRCARRAADEAGDPQTALWVRGHEVVRGPYEGRAIPAVLRLTTETAARVQSRAATAGLAHLYAGKAQALALAGRGPEALTALDSFRETFADLPSETVADRESEFGFAEDRLRFTESFVYSHLGDLDRADDAQRRAVALYPESYPAGPVKIELMRALCLVRSGDVGAGIAHAHTTMAALPTPYYTRTVTDLGNKVLSAVPDRQAANPRVREYRAHLAATCPGTPGRSRS